MKGRRIAVLAVVGVLATAALLAGCGSDSGSNASAAGESSAPLTKEQFIKGATELCSQGVAKKDEGVSTALKELAAEGQGAPTTQDNLKMVENAVLPPYRTTVEQLSQLGAPKGDEAKVEKMMGEFQSALKAVEANPVKTTTENPFAAADETAKAYGIDCRL